MRTMLMVVIGLIAAFVVAWLCFTNGCAYRRVCVEYALVSGRNEFYLTVPKGEYILQIREKNPGANPKTKFKVQGSINTGSETIPIDEAYTPSGSKWGPSCWFKHRGQSIRISLVYEQLGEGPPVYMFLGPHE